MIAQEQTYASIILRLLVDGGVEPYEKNNIVWGDLLYLAAQNGVLIRVVDQLEKIGLEPRHFFSATVKDMRARNQRKLSLINCISERCIEANIDFIFPKVFQTHPDLVGDIDLYVGPPSPEVDRFILRGLHPRPFKRTLRNRIEATANYELPGCDSVLEIHHGRVGMAGEHKMYISQLIENGRYVKVEGADFVIPSPEDQLILQALQRVVQRSYLRLSDVVTTINLLRNDALDWKYVIKTVNSLNSFYGLSCYLYFIEQIYHDTFGSSLIPAELNGYLVSQKPEIKFEDGFYRFRRLSVGGRGFADKFCSALLAENWTVATRLSLLPLLALTTAYRKLRVT